VKFGFVLSIYANGETHKQTDKHTDALITMLRTPTWGEVKIWDRHYRGGKCSYY